MKKIVSIAVAAAFVAPAVMAEVTVYGIAAPSVEYSKISDTASSDLSRVRLVDNASRIGFKGAEKLDNGLKLVWQAENRVFIGGGDGSQSTGFNTRDTFVALQGNFGELMAGTSINDLPYQSRGAYLYGLTPWNETVNGVHKTTNQSEARLADLAQYTSPVFLGGAKVTALYDFGNKNASGNYHGVQGAAWYKSQLFAVGATYKRNYDTNKSGSTATTDVAPIPGAYLKNLTLGGTLSPVKGLDISAMWDSLRKRSSATAVETQQTAWAVGANYMTGKHGFGVHLGMINDLNTQSDSGAKYVAAQYKYALSKKTSVHASISRVDNEANAKFNIGSTKVTESSGSYAASNGMKVTTIATGITTSF